MPRIRRARPDDGSAIEAIHAAAVRAGYRACYAPADVDAWIAGMATWRVGVDPARRDVLVAEEGGRIAGFAALDATAGEVTAVYVDPAAWRRGVGRGLLAAVETIARLRGVAPASLDASLNAVAFYEAAGWRRERGRDAIPRCACVHVAVKEQHRREGRRRLIRSGFPLEHVE